MALSGQLSDLSLAELIEFFCNQRKTGRLKIAYQQAPGYFYFDRGELVDAKIGALTGVDAVYYALTLENASFKFSTSFEATQRTIHQPWANVALEGLRRLDEGITPREAFPGGVAPAQNIEPDEDEAEARASRRAQAAQATEAVRAPEEEQAAPLSLMVAASNERGRSRALVYAAVVVALVLSVAAIGFPAGWYSKRKAVASAPAAAPEVKSETAAPAPADSSSNPSEPPVTEAANEADTTGGAANSNIFAVRQQQERQREARERMLAGQERAGMQSAAQNAPAQNQQATAPAEVKKPEAPAPPQKKSITVQVTYDENGRVTQASGGDGMAQRIARQKRFPAGKGGTTTVTIPVN
jgi:hypothetical protein